MGAEALRHSVPGLTRRVAAEIKTDTCRLLERERRKGAERVMVAEPGIVRGFDAMELDRRGPGQRHALIAADGCVPFRTSWVLAPRYDGRAVADMLGRDFDTFGAPLVLRLDRAAAHDVPDVRELLDAHRVLALHGPSYYARFYGQLERQNRDHRGWLQAAGTLAPAALAGCVAQLQATMNSDWPRRSLLWQTPEERWRQRPMLPDNRRALHEEVIERRARIQRHLTVHGKPADFTERLAIEQALTARGYLRRVPEGWC
jgi:hypothetical protein